MSQEFQHIDEDATFTQFGYRSTDLSPKSGKKVIVVCIDCKNQRVISKSNVVTKKNHSIRCNKCQRARHIISVRHDLTGEKRSEETKRKIGESNKIAQKKGNESPFYGRKMSAENKEKLRQSNKNRIYTQEIRDKISRAKKGIIPSEETRRKMSISRSGKRNHNYGKSAAHGKGQYFSASTGYVTWTRSLWEYNVCKFLDENNYQWQYEPQSFEIKYEYSGETKCGTYRPDFKVEINGNVEYWEVKGWWRDDALVKFEAFCSQYPDLQVKLLQRNELKALGILIRK